MKCYDALYPQLVAMGQECWAEQLQTTLSKQLLLERYGDMPEWLSALEALPEIQPSCIDLQDSVTIGASSDLGQITHEELITLLQAFHPWRKGPYSLFGVEIETEWRWPDAESWMWAAATATMAGGCVVSVRTLCLGLNRFWFQ